MFYTAPNAVRGYRVDVIGPLRQMISDTLATLRLPRREIAIAIPSGDSRLLGIDRLDNVPVVQCHVKRIELWRLKMKVQPKTMPVAMRTEPEPLYPYQFDEVLAHLS